MPAMQADAAPVVLVVDDDEGARRLIRMGLGLEGVVVVEAESLSRARQFLSRRMHGVVLDRELPDGDGLELLADIGAVCPDSLVVVNSTLDDGREPGWVTKVDKGDLPAILQALELASVEPGESRLAVIDLVRTEADAVVADWRELCRWDPLLPPESEPPVARLLVDAIADALQRPQPLGWGPDPAIAAVVEMFASGAGAVDVAVGQLICLREAFRRHIAGHVPPDEEAETRARVDMIIDRAIWTASRVAAARLQRQSVLDPVTGVGNRRALDADLDRELDRARRYRRPLTLVVLGAPTAATDDLDGAGEAQIRRLAGTLATNLRRQDGVYRIGGATFAALLVETSAVEAKEVLSRLGGAALAALNVSVGVATFPEDGDDAVTLLAAAEGRRLPATA